MSEVSRSTLSRAVSREWWLVLATMVVAGVVAFFAGGTSSTVWVGTGTVTVNQPALAKYPTMLFGDRMLDVLDSAEFRTKVAEAARMDAAKVRKNFSATATGKLLDRISVRYTAPSAEEAKSGVEALSKGIVAYAQEYNTPELTRMRSVADAGDAAVKKVRALQAKVGDDPFKQAEIETQLTLVEQQAITNRSTYQLADSAYGFDGKVSVAERTGSRGIDLIAGAMLVGLVAGLVLAVVRERVLARAGASA